MKNILFTCQWQTLCLSWKHLPSVSALQFFCVLNGYIIYINLNHQVRITKRSPSWGKFGGLDETLQQNTSVTIPVAGKKNCGVRQEKITLIQNNPDLWYDHEQNLITNKHLFLLFEGLHISVCRKRFWAGDGPGGRAAFLFLLSKLPELFDTVLLILAGRPVIFLHW